jgi:hypothetical protein
MTMVRSDATPQVSSTDVDHIQTMRYEMLASDPTYGCMFLTCFGLPDGSGSSWYASQTLTVGPMHVKATTGGDETLPSSLLNNCACSWRAAAAALAA